MNAKSLNRRRSLSSLASFMQSHHHFAPGILVKDQSGLIIRVEKVTMLEDGCARLIGTKMTKYFTVDQRSREKKFLVKHSPNQPVQIL